MSDADGDNVWDFTTQIGIGSYEYKFSADNWNIAENLDSTLSCVTTVTDSTGTFVNRTLVVSNSDIVLPVVYWNGCSTAPISGCTDSLAVNYNTNAVIDDGSCNYSSYTITTSGLAFVPDTIICDVGDTIFFINGPSHNAVEVSETTFLSGGTTALTGGFNFSFGASGFFIPSAPTTHYYVCQPHVSAGMVGVIIVNNFGCTNSAALNYDSTANIDDGSCNFSSYSIQTSSMSFNPDTVVCEVGDTIFLI